MNIATLCALGMGLAFAGMQMALKHILRGPVHGGIERRKVSGGWMLGERRKPDVAPWLFPALVGLLAPVWWWLAWLGADTGLLVWDTTWEAVRWPLAWAVVMVVSGTCFAWLIQRFSLSEVLGYKKGLITLGAAVVDIFVFETQIPWVTLGAIGLLLGGAGLLTGSRHGRAEWVQGAVLLGWCALVVGQLGLYKQGLLMQPDVLSYAVLAQGMASSLFLLLWLSPQVRGVKLPWRWVGVMLACVFAGNVMEGFAYAGENMAVVLVVSMLPATLLGVYDVWRGDLRVRTATWLGFVCLLAGFMLLLWR